MGSTIKDRRTVDTGHAHGWHIMVGYLPTVLSPSNHHINASSHITIVSFESFYCSPCHQYPLQKFVVPVIYRSTVVVWSKTKWSANKANKAHQTCFIFEVSTTGQKYGPQFGRDTSNAYLIKISLILNQLDRDGMELGCLCGTSGW